MPELLDGTKHIPWFQAGATIFDKKGIQYLGVPGLINAKSIIATLLVQVIPEYSTKHCSRVIGRLTCMKPVDTAFCQSCPHCLDILY